MTAVTQSRFRVSVTLEGISYGIWDSKSGGKLSSNATAFNPGNAGAQIAAAGTQTVETITVSRYYDTVRDHGNLHNLVAKAGHANCVVKQWPLDVNGAPYGAATTWTGIMSEVNFPDSDSTSNTIAKIEITITCNGNPST